MNKLQPLRGTKDLLGHEYKVHEYIINQAKNLAELYGYEGLSTPIIEYTNIFDRSLGETSDVVSKEIYSFLDKSENSIALRPEFTASVTRAVISNNLNNSLPLRFFSFGPLFRYDRPQSGRQRQFHQLNFEYIGVDGPHHDAEIINLAQDLLKNLDIAQHAVLEINSLGCSESKELYSNKLFGYFESYKDDLSEESLRRLTKNPLRILDSKDEGDQKIVQNAPIISENYTSDAKRYFEELLEYLEILRIKYQINPRLVRGLDYYCHTSFEYTTDKLGAQSSIIGGGRYDGLIKLMGGPQTPAIGFAAGIERLALMKEFKIAQKSPVVIMPLSQDDVTESMKLAQVLRGSLIATIIMDKGKIDKRLVKALDKGTSYVIFIGETERAQNKYKLKNLKDRTEEMLAIDEIVKYLNQ
jgi:histidyl-tRNA synthetase